MFLGQQDIYSGFWKDFRYRMAGFQWIAVLFLFKTASVSDK